MTTLQLKVINQSGAAQDVAVFQVQPDSNQGFPLVWLKQNINNNSNYTFKWEVDWGLNWGTIPKTLSAGVMYSSGGIVTSVDPFSATGDNALTITFQNADFMTTDVRHDTGISLGQMLVTTDRSFTVEQSSKMSIAVYMKDLPTFAYQGKPNGHYFFYTTPTYYLYVTDSKVGEALNKALIGNIDEAVIQSFSSTPTKVVFDSQTELSYMLNGTLEFVPNK